MSLSIILNFSAERPARATTTKEPPPPSGFLGIVFVFSPRLPDGDSQIFRLYFFWPFGRLEGLWLRYAMLQNLKKNFAICQPCFSRCSPLQPPRRQLPTASSAQRGQHHREPDRPQQRGGGGERAQVVDAAAGEQAAAGERPLRLDWLKWFSRCEVSRDFDVIRRLFTQQGYYQINRERKR